MYLLMVSVTERQRLVVQPFFTDIMLCLSTHSKLVLWQFRWLKDISTARSVIIPYSNNSYLEKKFQVFGYRGSHVCKTLIILGIYVMKNPTMQFLQCYPLWNLYLKSRWAAGEGGLFTNLITVINTVIDSGLFILILE